jgi:hypothetical protein
MEVMARLSVGGKGVFFVAEERQLVQSLTPETPVVRLSGKTPNISADPFGPNTRPIGIPTFCEPVQSREDT